MSSWLSSATPEARRAFYGFQSGSAEDADAHMRNFLAAKYIDAQMASRDGLHAHQDFVQDRDPELPASRGASPTRRDPPEDLPLTSIPRDAHWPHWLREDDPRHYDRDCEIRGYVEDVLPELQDLLDQAHPHVFVGEDAGSVWHCSVCHYEFCPEDLSHQDAVTARGFGIDAMVRTSQETGKMALDASNPRRFLRYIDALAWSHLEIHLHAIGVLLTWPKPFQAYLEPVAWWLAPDVPTHAHEPFPNAVLSLCARLSYNDEREGQRVREWVQIKTLRNARRGQHRACVNITRLRREARTRREDLVARMFEAGENVVTVARGLLQRRRKDEEFLQPWRLELARHASCLREGRARASARVLERAHVPARLGPDLDSD